jgi:RWD domain
MSLDVEIEAVRHVFEGLTYDFDSGSHMTAVCVPLRPYTGEDATAFVEVTTVFWMLPTYPETSPPDIKLKNYRGLSGARVSAIERRLRDDASELCGEMSLMCLCMAAQEQLTDYNYPEGVEQVNLTVLYGSMDM